MLFAGHAISLIVLSLTLYHQIQLMAGASVARRFAARGLAGTEQRANLQFT